MKTIITVAILLSTIISVEASCKYCLNLFTQYQDGVLLTMDGQYNQIWYITQESWCNGECEELTEKYWPSLAPALYQGFLNPYRVCSVVVEACDDPYQLDTCETCPYLLDILYENVLREESIAERVEFLKVECKNVEECDRFVDEYFPQIHTFLAERILDYEAICCNCADCLAYECCYS